MKTHRQELWFEVPTRRAFLNITPQVEAAVAASGVRDGLCLVNAMHISASVFINDDESGLHADYERWLEKLAPEKPHSQYDHNRTGEDPAAAGPTPTSSARSWAARSSSPSPPASSTSAPGSRSSTASSTAAGRSAS